MTCQPGPRPPHPPRPPQPTGPLGTALGAVGWLGTLARTSPPATERRPPPHRAPQALTAVADPLFGEWLHTQRGRLLQWALHCHAQAEDRREFMGQALAVHRQGGDLALRDWLLWASVLLARAAAERAPGAVLPMAPLPPELRCLLGLAISGTWRCADVLALYGLRMQAVRQALAAGQRASRVLPLC